MSSGTVWFGNDDTLESDGLFAEKTRSDSSSPSQKSRPHRRRKALILMVAFVLVSLLVVLIVLIAGPEVATLYGSPPTVAHHEGYEVTEKAYIEEVQAHMVVYRHKQTKTEVLTLIPKDTTQDSVFGVSFRTIPDSDTGVAHMLEHSVLDGSQKFPTKDPFNDMLRGSLETFLNAYTFDDRTVYAVASRNAVDFSNLVSVYLDAVFAPLCITDEGSWILRQEGWRIEEDETDGSLSLRGVVLSEMKGAYSDPDELMHRYAQQHLFPKTSYRFDSGGDPAKIPTLSRNDFEAFYDTYYHPTNAQMFVYGPLTDVKDALEQAHVYLKDQESRSDIRQESKVEWQELELETPVRVSKPYPNDSNDNRVMVSWLINDHALDTKMEIAWFVIDELLMGTPTSTLQKALQDSGLGENVIGGGVEFWLQQWSYHVGLSGISSPEDIEEVEKLIMDTLDVVVSTGFSDDEVASAMNTVEFSLRELNTGDDPRGLVILLSALRNWNYDRDPRAALQFEDALQELKTSMEQNGSELFVSLIRDRMVHNSHRVITQLVPSTTIEEEMELEEQVFLEQMRQQLTTHQFQALLDESDHLAQVQATDDSPEALATIPTLDLEDIDPVGDEYRTDTYTEADVLVAEHPVEFSFGILYVDFGIDMSMINLDDLALVPLLGRLMIESGTSTLDDVQLARKIGARTGGIDFEPMVESILPQATKDDSSYVVPNDQHLETKLFFRGKCTKEQVPDLFALYHEILFDGREFNKEKTITILKDMIADIRDAVIEDGDLYAKRRIAARYTVHGYIKEKLDGISNLQKLQEALDTANADWGLLWANLDRMKRDLIKAHRNGMVLNLTGEKHLLQQTQQEALHFVQDGIPLNEDATPFPNFAEEPHPWVAKAQEEMPLLAPLADEGIVVPTTVSYVGRGGILYSPGEVISGSAAVVTLYLELGYLYESLRLERGAYGANARLRKYSGMVYFSTYRDPSSVAETLGIFDDAAAALTEDIASSDTLPLAATDTIIGTIGALDGSAPQPDQVGWDSLRYHLRGETPEMRQAWRNQILGTTRGDFLSFASRLTEMKDASVAVVSSEAAIEQAELQGFDFEVISLGP